MKLFVLFATLFALTSTNEVFNVDYVGLDLKNLKFELDKEIVEEFLLKYEQAKLTRDDFDTVAVINEYADKLFVNIESYSLSHGLDPTGLTNVGGEFLTASITMTNGVLHGISTISRSSESVQVEYLSNEKQMELYVPVLFTNLEFTYDYHLIILLIGPSGSLTGKINELAMDIKLNFDFNTYHAQILQIETANAGHVDLTFHGNGVLDTVVDVLSEFVTTVLHPLIVRMIQGMVSDVATSVVDGVNAAIDNTLHPTASPEYVTLL